MLRRHNLIVGLLVFATTFSGCASVPEPEPPPPGPITTAGDTVVVTPPAQKCCKCSIWDLLGVPQIIGAFRNVARRIQSRLGTRFPGLEPTPPLKLIADPANLDSPFPSVAVAAEVKAEEDAAAQKAKAIKYLASLGCSGCYPDVEKALLASLADCNEEVRFATVTGLRNASGCPCCCCRSSACCSPEIIKALAKIAYGTDECGCPLEPSPRVRRVARLAMYACSGVAVPGEEEIEEIEGPVPPPEGPIPAEPPPEAPTLASLAAPRAPHSAAPMFAKFKQEASQPQRVLAVVHSEPIFESQIRPQVERRIAQQATRPTFRAQHAQQVWEDELNRAIDRKLLCREARQAGFAAQVVYHHELDQQDSAASEERLAQRWLKAAVTVDEAIAPHEVWRRYRTSLSQYARPAQVRWEIVLAPWAKFVSRQEAWQVLSQVQEKSLGKLSGPLPARASQLVAETIDWTSREQMPSADAAEMVFSMRVGDLTPILENEDGFFVVRLLERRPPTTISLDQAAPRIRDDIIAARRKSAEDAYIASLRRGGHTWRADTILR